MSGAVPDQIDHGEMSTECNKCVVYSAESSSVEWYQSSVALCLQLYYAANWGLRASFAVTVFPITIFCQINAPAWMNAPPNLTLPGHISETTETITITFSALDLEVLRSWHSEFHCSRTRLRLRFLPPRPARLFIKIQYCFLVNVMLCPWQSVRLQKTSMYTKRAFLHVKRLQCRLDQLELYSLHIVRTNYSWAIR